MAQTKFKIGDVVGLKSGGPEMTIKEIITRTVSFMGEATSELKQNEIKTQWFFNNELKSGTFNEDQLESLDGEDEE